MGNYTKAAKRVKFPHAPGLRVEIMVWATLLVEITHYGAGIIGHYLRSGFPRWDYSLGNIIGYPRSKALRAYYGAGRDGYRFNLSFYFRASIIVWATLLGTIAYSLNSMVKDARPSVMERSEVM